MRLGTTPLGFGIRFALIFGLLFLVFEASRDTRVEEFMIHDCVLLPAAGVINMAVPGEAVRVQDRRLVTLSSQLRITRGCEGVEMLLLLTAGIFAFPATFKHRAQGFLLGIVIVYALTIGRIMLLHFTLRYSPEAWDMLHGLILPLGPTVLIALYFLRWSAAGTTLTAQSRHVA